MLLKYPQHKSVLSAPEHIFDIQHNHTFCSQNYKSQINFLESLYDNEREVQILAEKKRYEIFLGLEKIKHLDKQIDGDLLDINLEEPDRKRQRVLNGSN